MFLSIGNMGLIDGVTYRSNVNGPSDIYYWELFIFHDKYSDAT